MLLKAEIIGLKLRQCHRVEYDLQPLVGKDHRSTALAQMRLHHRKRAIAKALQFDPILGVEIRHPMQTTGGNVEYEHIRILSSRQHIAPRPADKPVRTASTQQRIIAKAAQQQIMGSDAGGGRIVR